MAIADVEVSLSANAGTDEEHDLLLDEVWELKAALESLPGVLDGVRILPADATDDEEQGGELLKLALDLIPPAIESLLVLVQAWRERRQSKKAEANRAADVTSISGMKLTLTIKTEDREVHLEIDGSQDQVPQTAASVLAQLTGSAHQQALAAPEQG